MKNQYAMTEQQVESLAAERTTSLNATEGFDGTYLKVLINGVQAKLGAKRGKRLGTDTQMTTLDAIAAPFYAAVLRGVVTPEIELTPGLTVEDVQIRSRERNRRATFARTAKSTLVGWVRAGGDLRALDIEEVTKGELRASTAAAAGENRAPAASRVERAQRMILAAVAHDPPAVKRERLYAVISALQEVIDELPSNGDEHGESTVIRTRVGMPRFPPRMMARTGAVA